MDNSMTEEWGRVIDGKLLEVWPKDENGELEKPAFLCTCACVDMEDEMRVNMLEAYGIPCLRRYPGDGSFGKVIIGMSGNGTDIFVPQSLLSDAQALCKEENNDEL